MTRLRPAIVARRFWPRVGAMETRVAQLACGLADRGLEVTVVTPRWHRYWPAEIYFHGMRVVRLDPPPTGRWTTWRWKRSLAAWLRKNAEDFDLAYVWGILHEAHAAVQSIGHRMPVVLVPERTGWFGDCFQQVEMAGGRAVKDACLKAAAFVANNPIARRELEAAGYPRNRIHDIAPGVPFLPARTAETVTAARALLAEANAALQLPPQSPLVVSTARLDSVVNWKSLVAAWSTVAARRPAARLWFAGEAPMQAEIVAKIDWLGLTARAGPIGTFDAIDGLLTAADVLVASAPDGAPQAILEAMAAGIPSVAIDVPVNRWLLGNDAAGLLVPRDDSAAFATAVLRLLSEPDLAARLGNAGWQQVQRDFGLAEMIRGHLELIEQLHGERPYGR